jgi:type I restriction enzyme S subunit
MNNVTADGRLDLTKRRRICSDLPNIEKYRLQVGDILFNATNSVDLVGKAAYFPGLEEPAVFSNHFLRLRPAPRRLDGRYLARWLNLQFQQGAFEGMCRKWVNQATVNRDALLAMHLPLPPPSEQRRIAEILDKADALRARRRAALTQIGALTQSIFLEMFGDPATNSDKWSVQPFIRLLAAPLRNGLSPSKGGRITAKVLTLSAITGKAFDPQSVKTGTFQTLPPPEQSVDDHDLLICRGNGNLHLVGKGYFPSRRMPDVTFPDTMIAARVDREFTEPVFLEHVWNSPLVRRQLESAARTTNGTLKVNQSIVEGLLVFSPPLRMQREFGNRIAQVHKVRAKHCNALFTADALFASLQHRAFSGEL